jgi:uncharacterized protein (TIGR00251 family)
MALIIALKVVPSSGRSAVMLDKSRTLKIYLKSPPERGKANAELIALIAKALKIPQTDVTLLSGETARSKKIKINSALTFDQLLEALGISRQMIIGE